MLNNKKLVPVAVAAIVAAMAFIVWKVMDIAGPEDTVSNAGGQTPAQRKDLPDFGEFPSEFKIGESGLPGGSPGIAGPTVAGKGTK
jgi:hypothetical protein